MAEHSIRSLRLTVLNPLGGNEMQQKYTADPKTTEEICAFVKEYDSRFNARDPVALAELCTEDVVQIGPEGPICGRQSVEKKYVDLFQQWHSVKIVCTVDQVSAVGSVSWNSGDWSCTVQGENGPLLIKGYRLDVSRHSNNDSSCTRDGFVVRKMGCGTPRVTGREGLSEVRICRPAAVLPVPKVS
jgi:ketosteroid isomerase-like protein